MTAVSISIRTRQGIIYLRLSDFRDEDGITFEMRERELRELAELTGVDVIAVVRENDVDADGRIKGATAYKTRRRVLAADGLATYRTDRREFAAVLRQIQRGRDMVLIVGDDSRIARNARDGEDLIDAVRDGAASVLALGDDGEPRWLLRDGGSHAEVSALRDRINDARRYSSEIASKVRKGRRRWAGVSYQGGRRPFGYQIDADAPQHAKRLLVDAAEAKVIEYVADELLKNPPTSLAAITRELRERRVPTVTGVAWSTRTVRDVVLKPSVAGLAIRSGELVAAPWPAILDRPTWERVRDLLTDPARRTTTANEPRWLVSCFATCGVCGKPLRVGGAGRGRGPAYVGSECGHVRRNAIKVDQAIESAVLTVLDRDDDGELLKPPPRPTVDTTAIRAELRNIRARRGVLVAMFEDGELDEIELRASRRRLADRETAIELQLADSDLPDPLAEFRAGQRARSGRCCRCRAAAPSCNCSPSPS